MLYYTCCTTHAVLHMLYYTCCTVLTHAYLPTHTTHAVRHMLYCTHTRISPDVVSGYNRLDFIVTICALALQIAIWCAVAVPKEARQTLLVLRNLRMLSVLSTMDPIYRIIMSSFTKGLRCVCSV
jgi:hypothetical protein